jgi:hypothetical protein
MSKEPLKAVTVRIYNEQDLQDYETCQDYLEELNGNYGAQNVLLMAIRNLASSIEKYQETKRHFKALTSVRD